MRSESKDFEAHCAILEKIVEGYPEDSPEARALLAAAHAMHYVQHAEVEAKFRAWIDELEKPLTALHVLHAKLVGIEVPHELLDDTMREVDHLVERLKGKRS